MLQLGIALLDILGFVSNRYNDDDLSPVRIICKCHQTLYLSKLVRVDIWWDCNLGKKIKVNVRGNCNGRSMLSVIALCFNYTIPIPLHITRTIKVHYKSDLLSCVGRVKSAS